MVQVPAPTMVTVVPETVQSAVMSDVNDTGSPEDAVALTVNGASPKVLPPSDPKLMVCAVPAMVMANDWLAFGDMPLLAVNIPANVPVAVGVPLSRPLVLFNASP